MSSLNGLPSPGPDSLALDTTSGKNIDNGLDSDLAQCPLAPDFLIPDLTADPAKNDSSGISSTDPLGHQGGTQTGGIDLFAKVLWCDGLDLTHNFGKIFSLFKEYGPIIRIKAKVINKIVISAFITFVSPLSAKEALKDMQNRKEMSKVSFSIISSKNLAEEESDYIPELFSATPIEPTMKREEPIPMWHVVSYKVDNNNSLKGLFNLERCIGKIPEENFKKYGKGSLVKAKNNLQALMLQHFTPTEEDLISSVKPHNSFNLVRGVIYSEELQAFSNEEIVELCPSNIYRVQKLKGSNSAILLFFSTKYIPDYLKIRHLSFRVRKYKPSPIQCFNCFQYGHVATKCKKGKKCFKCSEELGQEENHSCSNYYCYHCEGEHSPKSRLCSRYKFEQDIIEIANNEYVSFGKAKGRLMGANKSPESTYAKVVAKIKLNNIEDHKPSPSLPQTPPTTGNSPSIQEPNTDHSLINPSQPVRSKDNIEEHKPSSSLPQTPPTTGNSPSTQEPNTDQSLINPSQPVRSKEKTQEDRTHRPRGKEHKNDDSKNNRDKNTPSKGPSEKPRNPKEHKSSPSIDEEGFMSLEGQKRARPDSPKGNNGLPTANTFSLLEESSPAKKKASKESAVATTSALTTRAKSHSPNRQMEVDKPQSLETQEKTRIPQLDRKLHRDKNSPNVFSQHKGKTGKPRFQL